MNKTVIVAPAIKTKFWKSVYKDFCRSKVPFHMVFVGHVKPDFTLPDNFTHIYCELSAAECAEIAYRYAYKHINDAKYIINIADDVRFPEYFLDKLIDFYNQKIEEHNNDFLLVSPMANGYYDEENLMAFYNGGPVLLGNMLTTIENSKKIGGIDKRFKAIYWDCDRHLRAHMTGANVIFASADELPPAKEIEYINAGGLWKTFSSVDMGLLKDLWEVTPGGDKEIFCSHLANHGAGRPTNMLIKNNLTLTRGSDVEEYDELYLGKYYE
tara:strand:+ start:5517 stop:6323 length:807 start_codon:yes stop_codon:yes gene_type:complete